MTNYPAHLWWWHAAKSNGITRLNRYSYLTEAAARRENPEAPWIMGALPQDMAQNLKGVK